MAIANAPKGTIATIERSDKLILIDRRRTKAGIPVKPPVINRRLFSDRILPILRPLWFKREVTSFTGADDDEVIIIPDRALTLDERLDKNRPPGIYRAGFRYASPQFLITPRSDDPEAPVPIVRLGDGTRREIVLPGNKDYQPGQRFLFPENIEDAPPPPEVGEWRPTGSRPHLDGEMPFWPERPGQFPKVSITVGELREKIMSTLLLPKIEHRQVPEGGKHKFVGLAPGPMGNNRVAVKGTIMAAARRRSSQGILGKQSFQEFGRLFEQEMARSHAEENHLRDAVGLLDRQDMALSHRLHQIETLARAARGRINALLGQEIDRLSFMASYGHYIGERLADIKTRDDLGSYREYIAERRNKFTATRDRVRAEREKRTAEIERLIEVRDEHVLNHAEFMAYKRERAERAKSRGEFFMPGDERKMVWSPDTTPHNEAVVFMLYDGKGRTDEIKETVGHLATYFYHLVKSRHTNIKVIRIKFPTQQAKVVETDGEFLAHEWEGNQNYGAALDKVMDVITNQLGSRNCHYYMLSVSSGLLSINMDYTREHRIMRRHILPVFQQILHVRAEPFATFESGVKAALDDLTTEEFPHLRKHEPRTPAQALGAFRKLYRAPREVMPRKKPTAPIEDNTPTRVAAALNI